MKIRSKIITVDTINPLNSKIEVILGYFRVTSESECQTLFKLFKTHKNASFHLSKENRMILCGSDISLSAFNQSISRLIKKGLIRKVDGKNYCLNPVFADIDTVDQVCFRFNS